MKRKLYIDESGWGCPVGGVTIGVMTEDGKGMFRTIHTKFFQGDVIDMQRLNEETVKQTAALLAKSSYNSDKDFIYVCRGPFWGAVRKYFDFNYIRYKAIKIIGKPQTELGRKNSVYLKSLGVPVKRELGHGGISFTDHVKWLAQDNARLLIMKTGWEGLRKHYKDKK